MIRLSHFAPPHTPQEVSMTERRPIPGYEGLYEVSDAGEVFSLDRTAFHLTSPSHKRRFPGRKIRPKREKHNGHLRVGLHENGKATLHSVHRLVMSSFVGAPPDGHQVCHNNGNTGDNRLLNLRYDTPKGNNADKKKHGTQHVGEKVPSSKLTDEKIRKIRQMSADGYSLRQIAIKFDITKANASVIVRRKTWQHVK